MGLPLPHDLAERQLTAEDALPELRLMQAVIVNAIMDAAARDDRASTHRLNRTEAERRRAIQWFEEAGPDFQMVCQLAKLDPGEVRKRVLSFLASERSKKAVRRVTHERARDALGVAAIATRAGVSESAARAVLSNGRGSKAMQARVLQARDELTAMHKEAA